MAAPFGRGVTCRSYPNPGEAKPAVPAALSRVEHRVTPLDRLVPDLEEPAGRTNTPNWTRIEDQHDNPDHSRVIRRTGSPHLIADTLGENHRMQDVFIHSGLPAASQAESGVVRVVVNLGLEKQPVYS